MECGLLGRPRRDRSERSTVIDVATSTEYLVHVFFAANPEGAFADFQCANASIFRTVGTSLTFFKRLLYMIGVNAKKEKKEKR